MTYLSDIEIAQQAPINPIYEIAHKIGIKDDFIEPYGKYKAKIDYNILGTTERANGKLVLVTAISPTPAGEGKTTTTIGLADGLRKIGKNSVVAGVTSDADYDNLTLPSGKTLIKAGE